VPAHEEHAARFTPPAGPNTSETAIAHAVVSPFAPITTTYGSSVTLDAPPSTSIVAEIVGPGAEVGVAAVCAAAGAYGGALVGELLGGDIQISSGIEPLASNTITLLSQLGQVSERVELGTMLTKPGGTPVFTALRVVDSQYPLYGIMQTVPKDAAQKLFLATGKPTILINENIKRDDQEEIIRAFRYVSYVELSQNKLDDLYNPFKKIIQKKLGNNYSKFFDKLKNNISNQKNFAEELKLILDEQNNGDRSFQSLPSCIITLLLLVVALPIPTI
jgi:hypothetical protein